MDEIETKIEAKNETEAQQTETEQPRKIVLGRKVVRQFAVKSGVQTGIIRCGHSGPP